MSTAASKFKVLMVDAPPDWDISLIAAELAPVGATLAVANLRAEGEIVQAAGDADGLLVLVARITRRVMESLPRLKVIGRCGIGVDTLDVEAATELGIAVCNTPGFCAREVADHTIMFMLACAKPLLPLHTCTRAGNWFGRSIAGDRPSLWRCTLGLIGFGEIGREVAKRALGFGVQVLASDPFVDQAAATTSGVTLVELDQLLARSDFVSIHAPLNQQTHHLMGERELRLMKPTSFLLNTARGSLVDEGALTRALRERWIAGAALDVFEQEPIDPDHPLLRMDNVLVTPHVAARSADSLPACQRRIGTALATVLSGGWPTRDLYNPRVKETAHRRQIQTDAW
ncbi:MAG: C-terminal binding protein [Chloroflexi bacterium]|nr:C-terminal binding protein [Chloroflexota bacterium]